MLREVPSAALSPRERETVLAIAEAVMPPSKRFPGAGAPTVARMEGYLENLGKSGVMAIRGILRAIDATAYARYLRGFARLSVERRLRLLESWRTGNYVGRTALRALLTPLKLAHFDDPS